VEIEKEEAAPFTEELSKQEMVDHLLQVHQMTSVMHNTLYPDGRRVKATKDQLVRVHEAAHKILDAPMDRRWADPGGRSRVGHYDAGTRTTTPVPTVEHVHADPAAAPEVRAMLDRAANNEPLVPEGQRLNASERAALTRLVDNDYAALQADLRSLAAATLENDLKQLELDWQDRRRQSQKWQAEIARMNRRFMKKREALRVNAGEQGIEISYSHRDSNNLGATVKTSGYDKAVTDAKNQNKRLLDTALLKLERERLRAQRRILLSAVSSAAAVILETIPSAEQMLAEAMTREVGDRELEGTKTDA
jgi:hypothetical protein